MTRQLVFVSAGGGQPQSKPQRVYVDGKLIGGIYPPALRLENGMLAVLRAGPDLWGSTRLLKNRKRLFQSLRRQF